MFIMTSDTYRIFIAVPALAASDTGTISHQTANPTVTGFSRCHGTVPSIPGVQGSLPRSCVIADVCVVNPAAAVGAPVVCVLPPVSLHLCLRLLLGVTYTRWRWLGLPRLLLQLLLLRWGWGWRGLRILLVLKPKSFHE